MPYKNAEDRNRIKLESNKRNKNRVNAGRRSLRAKYKEQVFDFYGGKCCRCGNSDYRVLHIHHSFGDGNEAREKIIGDSHRAGYGTYYDLIRRNFPKDEGIQLLCANCHIIVHCEWKNDQ